MIDRRLGVGKTAGLIINMKGLCNNHCSPASSFISIIVKHLIAYRAIRPRHSRAHRSKDDTVSQEIALDFERTAEFFQFNAFSH